jgi:hypothetical protein
VSLIAGAPLGEWTQGGQTVGALDTVGRATAAVSFVLLWFMSQAVLAGHRLGVFRNRASRLMRVVRWLTLVYAVLGIIVNVITPSANERMVWAPVSVLLFLLLVRALKTRR